MGTGGVKAVVLLAFLPPLLVWLWVRWKVRDDVDPTPFMKFFIFGTLLGVPLAFIELPLVGWSRTFSATTIRAVLEGLTAGVVEEMGRVAVLAYAIYRKRGFARPRWIIGVSLALAMGFVAVENLFWLSIQQDGVGLLRTILHRTLLTVPVAAALGLTVGVMTAWWQMRGESWMRGMVAGVGLAIVVHVLYDAGLSISAEIVDKSYSDYAAFAIAVLAVMLAFLPVRIRFKSIMEAVA
jgi:RsiW-degrading membrane proteinase PrsW (M82 family)